MKIYNGTYTITSPTGEHRTFQIRTQDAEASFAPGKRIISLLTGSNNETDYTGFGFVTDEGITVWSKKRTPDGSGQFEKYARLVYSMATLGEESPFAKKGAVLLLEKRCMRCNRKLTNPTSIEAGIGPECAGR